MFLVAKIIGSLCAVVVPAGVCGTQALLSKKQQTINKAKIEAEFNKTNNDLSIATNNYQKEISRISVEKNALLTTKQTLTYVPVDIQTTIEKLNVAKTNYQNHHTQLQTKITSAIEAHNKQLTQSKTTIENLWKAEKARVEKIQSNLETEITNSKTQNSTLQENIESIKTSINNNINGIFNPPSP